MKQYFIEYGWILYLAGSLAALDIFVTTWQYWLIMVPMLFLKKLSDRKNSKQ